MYEIEFNHCWLFHYIYKYNIDHGQTYKKRETTWAKTMKKKFDIIFFCVPEAMNTLWGYNFEIIKNDRAMNAMLNVTHSVLHMIEKER